MGIPGGRGSTMNPFGMENPRGWGVKLEEPSMGSMDIFWNYTIPTGQLQAHKTKAKSHIINNLLTSNVQSSWGDLKPHPCRID